MLKLFRYFRLFTKTILNVETFSLFQAFYENNFVEKGQLESYKQELEAKVCKGVCALLLVQCRVMCKDSGHILGVNISHLTSYRP